MSISNRRIIRASALWRRSRPGIALLAGLYIALASPAHAQQYTVNDLGTLGGSSSSGSSINASGQVTGYSDVTGGAGTHAFLYGGGTMHDLGTLSGSSSFGSGINTSGQVTGSGDISGGYFHAFLYSGTTLQDLGTLGGVQTESRGVSINASAQVTGYSSTSGSSAHAFLYSGGSMKDLGTLGGATSYGQSINATGLVTGTLTLHETRRLTRSSLYTNGKMSDLNTLDTANALAQFLTLTQGDAINDNGVIVADGTDARTGYNHAYLLTPIASPSILWQNSNGNVVRWFVNGGTITSSANLGVLPAGWIIQGTGDFNGVGHSDILWRNTNTGDVVLWFMNRGTIAA